MVGRKPTLFSEAQDAVIRREWSNRQSSLEDIAEMLGKSRAAVRYRGQVFLGLGAKVTNTHGSEQREALAKLWADPKLSADAIGQRLGIPRNTVISLARRMKLPPKVSAIWTGEKIDALKALWAEGLSATEIGRRLGGLSKNTIRSKAMRLGLKPRDPVTATMIHRRNTPRTPPKHMATPKPPVAAKPAPQPPPRKAAEAQPAKIATVVLDPPEAPPKRNPWLALPGIEPIRRMDAEHRHCKWPITVNGDELSHCCGAVRVEGPYCPSHNRRAFQPGQQKKIRPPADPYVATRRRAA